MIFINGQRHEITQEQRDKLKEMFPTFFRDNNPEALRTKYMPTMITRNSEGDQIMSPAVYLANRVTLHDETGSYEVVYTTQAPRVNPKTNDLEFHDGGVLTRHNMPIRPGKGLELLVFLMFYSTQVKNGLAPEKSKIPKITVESKASEAATRNAARKLYANFEALVISDSGLPDDKIRQLAGVFNINETDPEVIRDRLLTLAKNARTGQANVEFIEKFMASADKDYLKIRALVEEAYDKGILAQDKDNYDWQISDGDGMFKFYAKYGSANVKDPLGFLVNYMASRPADIERIRLAVQPAGGNDGKTIADFHPMQKKKVLALVKGMTEEQFENFFSTAELGWHMSWKEEAEENRLNPA